MANSVNAKRMLATRKLLTVSTLGTAFFLLGARANAAVIGDIQAKLDFDFSPTGTVFLDPGQTQKLVSVEALSTLTAIFSTGPGRTFGAEVINFVFSGGQITNSSNINVIRVSGAGMKTETLEHQFSQNFLLSPGTYTVSVFGYIRASGKSDDFPLEKVGSFTVAKVPEPLTILGSGVALGFGALFKKSISKNRKKLKA